MYLPTRISRYISICNISVFLFQVLENVKMDPVTKSPTFKFESKSALYDGVTQEINISKAIATNKFDKRDLVTGQKDIKAFRELFGEIKDARRTIVNNMQAMASITARDKFYNTIVQSGKIVFDSPTKAQLNLPNRPGYTMARNGMQIKSPLGEEIYTNPMNKKFTSSEFEEAIKFAESMPFDNLMTVEALCSFPQFMLIIILTIFKSKLSLRTLISLVSGWPEIFALVPVIGLPEDLIKSLTKSRFGTLNPTHPSFSISPL